MQRCIGEPLDRFDLGVRHRLGPAAGADEVGDAHHVEHAETLDEGKAGEAVAGEERKADFLPAVLPPAPALDDR